MTEKSKMEREDYTGPLEPEIDLAEFSKEFLLKLMRCWSELYEAYQSTLVKLAPDLGIDGFGWKEMLELQVRTMREAAPPVMEKIAKLCKVDADTIEGRLKLTRFIPDNMMDHYTGEKFEILNDKEATMTIDSCYLFKQGLVGGDPDILHQVCYYADPKIGEAYMSLPGKTKVVAKMLKVPESQEPPPPGEPLCMWHFKIED